MNKIHRLPAMTGLEVEYVLFLLQEKKCKECLGEQICICKYSLSHCHYIWDSRVAKPKTDKTSYFSIYKVCTQRFQPSDFFFSLYQNILLCKAHHSKFLSPAQLQHNASHHGWLGENAGWVRSVFGLCNWNMNPCFLTTHCCKIPLSPSWWN